MTVKVEIRSTKLSPPIGPFSAAVHMGDYIFLSGQVGQDPASGRLVPGGVEREAQQILANLKELLAAAGKTTSDLPLGASVEMDFIVHAAQPGRRTRKEGT